MWEPWLSWRHSDLGIQVYRGSFWHMYYNQVPLSWICECICSYIAYSDHNRDCVLNYIDVVLCGDILFKVIYVHGIFNSRNRQWTRSHGSSYWSWANKVLCDEGCQHALLVIAQMHTFSPHSALLWTLLHWHFNSIPEVCTMTVIAGPIHSITRCCWWVTELMQTQAMITGSWRTGERRLQS